MNRKRKTLLLLALGELLAMAVWFSASAVVPALAAAWSLDDNGRAWLTMSVQAGFVAGALISAVFSLPDRLPTHGLFGGCALVAALMTALIPLVANDLGPALVLRFLTGALLAGVYPVGMKIMATWTKADRGLGIGIVVGAVTLGSSAPHLLNALGGLGGWQPVLYGSAALAALGGLLALASVRDGPYKSKSPPFNWRFIGQILRQRDVVLANLGYLGHMWELYAMWAWISAFMLASFASAGGAVELRWAPAQASLVTFGIIGIGGVGSLVTGVLADRVGRTTVAITALALSGLCALTIGQLFGGAPWLVIAVGLVWGVAVVADSAQFSACVSELCQPEYTGTALTLQTSLGYLLTLITIRLLPTAVAWVGWSWAFAFLALGPAVGITAMVVLRRTASARLAGGRG